MEMDLSQKLSTSNSELQDKFDLALLEHLGKLTFKEGSTPEGRRAEIEFVTKSVGTLVTSNVVIHFLGA